MMNITLCTLFEGNYHYGVAALANSLAAAGYKGDLWVGYRGALPDWLLQSPDYDTASASLRVTPGFALRMVLLDTPLHFTYYKPTFLREVLERHAPTATQVGYIDPDIVLKCDWPAFAGWFSEDAISLAEDVNWRFPARHPKRLLWQQFFAPQGWQPVRALESYYNGGFVAVSRAHFAFLDDWTALCHQVLDYNKGIKHLKAGGSAALFHSTDQDAMNFALSLHAMPLNTAGPEAMDFATGGYYLSHAIGSHKPWHGGHLKQALRGLPPSAATKAYYRFANAPLQPYRAQAGTLRLREWELKAAGALGRVYRRA